jgi:hypothetical protein
LKAFAIPETLSLDTSILLTQNHIISYAGYCTDCFSGDLGDQMAFRTAIYVGVHLTGWYNRRPRKGLKLAPPEVIVAGLTVGRDFILKGWEKDRKFFEGSALTPLFGTK